MLKLTSLIENVFGNISDIIRHVLETKRKTRKEKKGENVTEISAIIYTPEMLKMLEDGVSVKCRSCTLEMLSILWLLREFSLRLP